MAAEKRDIIYTVNPVRMAGEMNMRFDGNEFVGFYMVVTVVYFCDCDDDEYFLTVICQYSFFGVALL